MTDELYIPAPATKDTRMLGIGLALAAAALLLFAAFSRHWLSRPMLNDIGFGPRGCANCDVFGGGGHMSNGAFVSALRETEPSAAETTSGAFAPMGWATFGLCIAASLGLIAAAALAFMRKRLELPIAPTTVALLAIMISLITGCVFVATKPGGPGFVGVAIGFWCFGVGSVLGIAAAQMLAKTLRPVDPDLLAGAMNPDQF